MAVLCARRDSVYKTLPNCCVYDDLRDARSFEGGMPVVCHPPCAQWSRLFRFAADRPLEKALAPFCVDVVRREGGVLEHPAFSRLWRECGLPLPGERDGWGRTIGISQYWFGHAAEKRTWLYIVGAREVFELPFTMGYPQVTCGKSRLRSRREQPKADRERTPEAFARWLVDLAAQCYT